MDKVQQELGLAPNDLAISNAKMTFPYLVIYYDVDRWEYDTYDRNGYVGREVKNLRKPTADSPLYAGVFKPKDYPNDGQPDGGS